MAAKHVLPLIGAIFLMTHTVVVNAQTAPSGPSATDAIRYAVSFPAPQTHYVEVSAAVPTSGRPQVDLMMAVWTPGSYLVREFSRHVENVTAVDAGGRALAIEKTEKNHWRVTTGAAPSASVRKVGAPFSRAKPDSIQLVRTDISRP